MHHGTRGRALLLASLAAALCCPEAAAQPQPAGWWEALPGSSPAASPQAPARAPQGPQAWPGAPQRGAAPAAPPPPRRPAAGPAAFPPPLEAGPAPSPAPPFPVGLEAAAATPPPPSPAAAAAPAAAPAAEPAPPRWVTPAPRPLRIWGLALQTALLTGQARGPLAASHRIEGLGGEANLELRLWGLLGLRVGFAAPPAQSSDENEAPIRSDASLRLLSGGLRLYLTERGLLRPSFGLGYSRIRLTTTYDYDQSEIFGTTSTELGTFETGGDALQAEAGLELRMASFELAGSPLELLAQVEARYLLARWDRIHCSDDGFLGDSLDAAGRACLYESEGGDFQASDLLLVAVGLGLRLP